MDDDENDVISAALTSCFDGAEKIAEHWQAFDMISLREGLDTQAEEIASELEARKIARKALAQQVKEYKAKVSDEADPLSVEGGNLIKAFKQEVDATTKRAKVAEASFLSLYRALRNEDLADPSVALRQCARLGRAGLEHFSRQLEKKSKMEAKAEVLVGRLSELGLIKPRASSSGGESGGGGGSERPSSLHVLEGILAEERAALAEEAARAAQVGVEAERLGLARRADGAVAAVKAECDAAVAALEAELASAQAEVRKGTALALHAADLERTAKEAKDAKAVAEAHAARCAREVEEGRDALRACETERAVARADLVEGRAAAEAAQARAAEQAAAAAARCEAAEAEAAALRARPTAEAVASLQQRLRALEHQRFGIAGGSDSGSGSGSGSESSSEEEGSGGDGEGDGGEGTATGSAESGGEKRREGEEGEEECIDWALHRADSLARRLDRERARRQALEREVKEVCGARDALGARVSGLEGDLRDAHAVVDAGKHMLRAFQSVKPDYAKGGRGGGAHNNAAAPAASSSGWLSWLGAETRTASTAGEEQRERDLLLALPELEEEDGDLDDGQGLGGFGAADRLLDAVRGQRDRFRQQAARREGELQLAKRLGAQQSAEVQTLRRDNAALYKRVRFLSATAGAANRSSAKGQQSGGGGPQAPPCADVEAGGDRGDADGVERRYAALYEQSLDPFGQWERGERARANARLLPHERFLLAVVGPQARSGAPWRRLGVAAHLLLVHVLLLWCGLPVLSITAAPTQPWRSLGPEEALGALSSAR